MRKSFSLPLYVVLMIDTLIMEALAGRWVGEILTVDYGRTILTAPGTSLDMGEHVMIDLFKV